MAQFDYLSTVSGGGFIGAWLQALIRQQGSPQAAEALLRTQEAAAPVSALRSFTNYLTPHRGILSEDSWTGIVLYLRNLLINWFGFGAIFLLAVLSAIAYRTALWGASLVPATEPVWLALGAVGLVVATWRVCRDLPSHRPMRNRGGLPCVDYLPEAAIRRWIVWPMVTWAFLVPAAIAPGLAMAPGTGGIPELAVLAVYAGGLVAGYLIAAASRRALALYVRNAGAWMAATVASGVFLWIGLHLAGKLHCTDPQHCHDTEAEMLAILAPLWLILANILHSTVHIALRREALLGDLDREWLARLSALKLRVVLLWSLFAVCCLSLQRVAFSGDRSAWAVSLTTLLSGPIAAMLGKQVDPKAITQALWGRVNVWGLPALSLVFAAGLLAVLSQLVTKWLTIFQLHLLGPGTEAHSSLSLLGVQLGFGLLLALLVWHAMRRIDVNRFSMHGTYRNRLTRAFLGAARANRRPDLFTGFDPEDNPRMADLAATRGPRKLFPVINVALNLTASKRTAWEERKAAAFTVTPLACGSPVLQCPAAKRQDAALPGCYVTTASYAGREHETARMHEQMGMTLATAMTISGAAVSPNWGYHSSPVTAFLMTLFNLRLGAWLPNPAVVTDPEALRLARPRNAFAPMLGDLLGNSTDSAPAIYLSDGGHFDNLGLYEMLRRRCRLIMVIDAGQDGACAFEDLGGALRKARIDQQIHIDIAAATRIGSRANPLAQPFDFAIGEVAYPEGGTGTLLYCKPCYLSGIPADIRAYGAANVEFPHQSTLEQWFTESQFESYRHLGEYQIQQLAAPGGTLAALFAGIAPNQPP